MFYTVFWFCISAFCSIVMRTLTINPLNTEIPQKALQLNLLRTLIVYKSWCTVREFVPPLIQGLNTLLMHPPLTNSRIEDIRHLMMQATHYIRQGTYSTSFPSAERFTPRSHFPAWLQLDGISCKWSTKPVISYQKVKHACAFSKHDAFLNACVQWLSHSAMYSSSDVPAHKFCFVLEWNI